MGGCVSTAMSSDRFPTGQFRTRASRPNRTKAYSLRVDFRGDSHRSSPVSSQARPTSHKKGGQIYFQLNTDYP